MLTDFRFASDTALTSNRGHGEAPFMNKVRKQDKNTYRISYFTSPGDSFKLSKLKKIALRHIESENNISTLVYI